MISVSTHDFSRASLGGLSPSFGDFGGQPKAQRTGTIEAGVTPVKASTEAPYKKMDGQTAQIARNFDGFVDGRLNEADGLGRALDRVGNGSLAIAGVLTNFAAQGLRGGSQTLTQAATEPSGQAAPPAYLSQVAGLLSNVSNDYQDISTANSGQLGRWDVVAQDQSESRGTAV